MKLFSPIKRRTLGAMPRMKIMRLEMLETNRNKERKRDNLPDPTFCSCHREE